MNHSLSAPLEHRERNFLGGFWKSSLRWEQNKLEQGQQCRLKVTQIWKIRKWKLIDWKRNVRTDDYRMEGKGRVSSNTGTFSSAICKANEGYPRSFQKLVFLFSSSSLLVFLQNKQLNFSKVIDKENYKVFGLHLLPPTWSCLFHKLQCRIHILFL